MASWTNADGLTVYFGQSENNQNIGGEYRTNGTFREEEFSINLASLTNTDTVIIPTIFPWGKVLEKVEVIADIPATGGGTFDVGFVNLRTGAAIAAQGAIAAMPTSAVNVEGKDTVLTVGSTYGGTLLGTTVAAAKYTNIGITAKYTTTAFTAGRVRIKFSWYKKLPTN